MFQAAVFSVKKVFATFLIGGALLISGQKDANGLVELYEILLKCCIFGVAERND